MNPVRSAVDSVRQAWNEFFFREEVPYGLALMRICLSGLMLVVMGRRWMVARELFSLDGAPAPISINYGIPDMLPLLSGNWAVGLFGVLMFALFTLMIGWKTRLSAWCVFLLYTYFTLQDSLSTLTKYTVIASHAFLILSLADCGAVWSIDRLQELKRQGLPRPLWLLGAGRAVPVWPQRMLQLMIAIVYFGAAVTKLQTSTYFTGDQLRFWLLTNVNHDNPIGEWMSLQPALLIPMGYIAIVWEITFILMIWKNRVRVGYLLMGAMFHISTLFMLGLYVFPLVCISIYATYLTSADVAWWREFVARRRGWKTVCRSLAALPRGVAERLTQPLGAAGYAGFCGLMLLLAAGGLMLERSRDLYAAATPSGKYELKVIPPERARELFRTDPVIQEQDKLMSFDVGRYMIGGVVIDGTRRFQHGTDLYVQANLIPPHGDLYLECNLHSADGMLIDRSQGVATRDNFRYTFPYRMSGILEPGKYQFVLRMNNQEVARKTIEILPNQTATAKPIPVVTPSAEPTPVDFVQ